MTNEQTIYLRVELQKLHPHNDMFVGYQLGLVEAGYKGVNLHDDTCKIITSDIFRNQTFHINYDMSDCSEGCNACGYLNCSNK